MDNKKDSVRRKRVPDRIDVGPGLPCSRFNPTEWVEDFVTMLETNKLNHASHMDSPVKQRQKATSVLKIVGHHLNEHPELRGSDWSDSMSLIVMALDGLENGKVEQVLLPSKKADGKLGAPKFSPLEMDFIGFVLLAHSLLVDAGYQLVKADEKIAELLTRAGFHGRQGIGFSSTTISGWRTNYPEKSDAYSNRLLDRRLTGFLPAIRKMKAEGKTKADITLWIDKTIIRSEQLRMLRPKPISR